MRTKINIVDVVDHAYGIVIIIGLLIAIALEIATYINLS